MSKAGLKEIADVTFLDIATKIPVLFFDTLKISTIENEAESTAVNGGKGNPKLVTWDYNRTATLTMQDALISAKTLAVLAGNGADSTGKAVINGREKVVVPTGGAVTLQKTPVEGGVVTVVDFSDGELGEVIEGAVVAGAEITGLTAGDLVMIYYKHEAGAKTQVVTFSTDAFPSTYEVFGDTLVRDAKTNTDKVAQFQIPRAQLKAGFSLTMEAENPSVFDFNLEMLKDANSTKLYDFIIAD